MHDNIANFSSSHSRACFESQVQIGNMVSMRASAYPYTITRANSYFYGAINKKTSSVHREKSLYKLPKTLLFKRLFPLFNIVISFLLLAFLIFHQAALFQKSALTKKITSNKDPAIEQQIDIQDINMTTTSPSYTDANISGSFLWNSQRYSSLQHVYFEAGIAKSGTNNTTKRIRSGDILANLVSGTTYKVRIQYGCSYNSTTNTFTETGYAELWSSDNTTEVTASAVSSPINTGTGTCPTTPTTVAVRFSRLIILQSDPTMITDTDTMINIGHMENQTLTDTNDHSLKYPKIWSFTDHTKHPTAGWDSIQDILFSSTLASHKGTSVSACLYDITANTEVTCVSTTNTVPSYVTSSDISGQLTDGDQYEIYLKVSTPNTAVILYNSYVTVEQSNPNGLSNMELYHVFNPYNISTSGTTFGHGFFMNYWEPANFNIASPNSNEILSLHVEATESISSTTATGSVILYNTCAPNGGCYPVAPGTVLGSNVVTTNTGFTRIRTADNAFTMVASNELDEAEAVTTGSGTITGNVTWLVINVNFIPNYQVQVISNVSYGPEPNEVMDECLPIGAPSGEPGILFIHGGGWGYQPETRSHYSALCQQYAAEGYIVNNIDYRLAPTYQWTDQGGDVQLAVRNMRASAQLWGLDPTRICAYGDSAGAHLSLLTDTMQTTHNADVAPILATISPSVSCLVDQFGPYDLAKLYNESKSTSTAIPALYNFLDYQTPQSNPAIYTDASPNTYISSQSGQALIIQGTKDTTVLPDQSQELQQDMQTLGVPNQFMQFVGGHEYANLS